MRPKTPSPAPIGLDFDFELSLPLQSRGLDHRLRAVPYEQPQLPGKSGTDNTRIGPRASPRLCSTAAGCTVAKKRTHQTPLVFNGYTVEVIQRWCAVSPQTAYLYKIGARKPSRQSLRLFVLHRDGLVLSGAWAKCCVREDRLFDPDGQPITVSQLRAYLIVMQMAAEYARQLGPKQQLQFYEVLRLA